MAKPNTNAIADSIVSLLQVQTLNGSPIYSLTKKGAVIDPTDITTYAAVTFQSRNTKRYDSGWKLNSTPVFQIESGVDYSAGGDTTTVETLIIDIGDTLTSLFAARYTLNSVPGVYVTLVDMDDKAAYKAYPNGRIYRVHLCYCKAIDQYNVQLLP